MVPKKRVVMPEFELVSSPQIRMADVREYLHGRFSFEEFERVVWISDGGERVSPDAVAEGWEVPYHNPTQTPPKEKP